MKINIFQGDLTDISAKKEALATSALLSWILYKPKRYVAADVSGSMSSFSKSNNRFVMLTSYTCNI